MELEKHLMLNLYFAFNYITPPPSPFTRRITLNMYLRSSIKGGRGGGRGGG